MRRAAIKLQHHQVAWLRLKVHARWCQVAPWTELLWVGNVNLSRVSGKFRLCTGKFKTTRLANNAAASIASHEPSTPEGLVAALDSYPVFGLMKASHGKPAFDFYSQGFCAA